MMNVVSSSLNTTHHLHLCSPPPPPPPRARCCSLQPHSTSIGAFRFATVATSYAADDHTNSAHKELPGQEAQISWTKLISDKTHNGQCTEALKIYREMREAGVRPNTYTFVAVLKACARLEDLQVGKEIHALVVEIGVESQIFVANTLINMYAKCGSTENARHVFDRMRFRNVVTWNAMIVGYAQRDEVELALDLFDRMLHANVVANARTFVGALKACSSMAAQEEGKGIDGKVVKLRSLKKGKSIHSQIAQSGFISDRFVSTTLVDMYAKCGSMEDACQVFNCMPVRDVVAWNAMIVGYAQMEEGELALQLYAHMQQHEGFAADAQTFAGALKACGSVAALEIGKKIHSEIRRAGLEGDSKLANSLIDMYGKCGSMEDAQQLFDGLCMRGIVTWNSLIAGYNRQGDIKSIFNLLQRMHEEGIPPDNITFLSILNVCSHMGMVEQGEKYFQAMNADNRITRTIDHYNCMIDLLGRAGRLDEAMLMVKEMPFPPNMATWRTILSACKKWNNVEVGKCAFDYAVGLDDNQAATYVLMSNIYAAAARHKIQEVRMNY